MDIPPKLTISEAIRVSGIARATFYRSYVDTGKISVSVGNDKKKYIDSAELLRVFPNADYSQKDNQTDNPPVVQKGIVDGINNSDNYRTTELQRQIDSLELELRLIHERLVDAVDTVRYLKQDIDERKETIRQQADTIQSLTNKIETQPPKQIGWFGKLMGRT